MRTLKLMPLEDRIVLDAALIATLMTNAVERHIDHDFSFSREATAELFADKMLSPPNLPSPLPVREKVNLLIVSSDVKNADTLFNASQVETVIYDANHASLSSILSAIQAQLGGRLADTIAFAGEGQAEQLQLTNTLTVIRPLLKMPPCSNFGAV